MQHPEDVEISPLVSMIAGSAAQMQLQMAVSGPEASLSTQIVATERYNGNINHIKKQIGTLVDLMRHIVLTFDIQSSRILVVGAMSRS